MTWPKTLTDAKVAVTSTTIIGTLSGGFAISAKQLSGGDGNPLSGPSAGIVMPLRSVLAPVAVNLDARSSAMGSGEMRLFPEIVSWSGNIVDVRVYASSGAVLARSGAEGPPLTMASGTGLSGATLILVALGR